MATTSRVTLPASASTVSTNYGFEMAGDYAFYDRNADASLKPEYYKHILQNAKKIIIWDPHFMENEDGKLFEAVTQQDVEINILSVCQRSRLGSQEEKDVLTLRDNIKDVLRKAGITRFSGYVNAFKSNKESWNGSRIYPCHDRFWIIDDKVAYIVGASMNNMLGSEWTYGIMKIENNTNYDIFKKITEKYDDMIRKISRTNCWKGRLQP